MTLLQNPTVGTEVTLLLENNTIKLFKGNKDVKRFTLTSVKTPILIKTSECLSIHDGKGESLLCFPNSYSLNNWWMSITKQILCNNQGDVRNEVYGEASLEEIQTDVDSLHSDEDKRGINIHIDEKDPAKLPQIKVHYKE
ncbi:serine threonine kinase [Babesia ovis]|uniref:Serine threonine kinase n=1 Tax=Babesia ovis TaxID=5869 RepID=A0A9W5T9I0_BABOV|nr:serine threonine kinase [Babesia ovis]